MNHRITSILSLPVGVLLACVLMAAPVEEAVGDSQQSQNRAQITISGSQDATEAADQQESAKPQSPGWMGVRVGRVPEHTATQLKLPRNEAGEPAAVLVLDIVQSGPAHQAGLKQHDIITTIGDKPVNGYLAFVSRFVNTKAGDQVKLGVLQGGQKMVMEIQLTEPVPKADRIYTDPNQNRRVAAENIVVRGVRVERTETGWAVRPVAEHDPKLRRLYADAEEHGMKLDTVVFRHDSHAVACKKLEDGQILMKQLPLDAEASTEPTEQRFADLATFEKQHPELAAAYLRGIANHRDQLVRQLIKTAPADANVQRLIEQKLQDEPLTDQAAANPDTAESTPSAQYTFERIDGKLQVTKSVGPHKLIYLVDEPDELQKIDPKASEAYQQLHESE